MATDPKTSKFTPRTWFSLLLVGLLLISIALTQIATRITRDNRSQAASPSLTFSYSRPNSYWTMRSTTCSNNGNISGTTSGLSAVSGTYEFSPYCYVSWTVRPVSENFTVMRSGSGNANGVGTFSIRWEWDYDMRIYPASSGSCSAAGTNCKSIHENSTDSSSFRNTFTELLYSTTYLGDVCAPNCSSGNWSDMGITVGTTTAAPPPPPPSPLVPPPVKTSGPKLTPVGQQPSQPVSSSDITLNFAANTYLKGGMEVIVNIDSTGVSQKIVADNKGGSFILKPGNLTKAVVYRLTISSKNSLVVAVPLTYADNLSLSVPELTTGDFNNDNQINQSDLDKLKESGFKSQDSLYDINYDSVVNSIDYSLLLRNLGKKGN